MKGTSVVNNPDICKAIQNNSHLQSNVIYKFNGKRRFSPEDQEKQSGGQ